MQVVPRNAPCICGSGKKFKKCCLEKDSANQDQYGTYRALVGKVLDFVSSREEFLDEIAEASEIFFGKRENLGLIDSKDHDTRGFFNEWLAFDYVLNFDDAEENITFMDLFIREAWNILLDQEKAIAESLRDSFRTIVEVQSVRPNEGVEVKDLITGEIYFVYELRGSHELVQWDCLFTRIYKDEGRYHFSGVIEPIERENVFPLIALIKETVSLAFQEEKKDGVVKKEFTKEILKAYGYLISREVLELRSCRRMPTMVTTTGEPFVFCTLEYTVNNYSAVYEFLKGHFKKVNGENKGGHVFYSLNREDTIIASFTLKANNLIVETKSVKRAEKTKKLLTKYCGKNLVLQKFKQKSLEEAFEEVKDNKDKLAEPQETIPQDKAFEEEVFKRTYGKWEKTRIPLLNDMTPLQAMKTKQGRILLMELFKIYENYEQRSRKQGTFFSTIDVTARLKEKIKFDA